MSIIAIDNQKATTLDYTSTFLMHVGNAKKNHDVVDVLRKLSNEILQWYYEERSPQPHLEQL